MHVAIITSTLPVSHCSLSLFPHFVFRDQPLDYFNEICVSINKIISSCHSCSSVLEIITSFGHFPTFCQFSKLFWSHLWDSCGSFAQRVSESIRMSPECLPLTTANDLHWRVKHVPALKPGKAPNFKISTQCFPKIRNWTLALAVPLDIDDIVICPMTLRKKSSSLASVVKKSFTRYLHGRRTLFKFSLENCWIWSSEKKLESFNAKDMLLMGTMLRRTFVRITVRALWWR